MKEFLKDFKTGASRWTLFAVVIVDARNHEPEIYIKKFFYMAKLLFDPSQYRLHGETVTFVLLLISFTNSEFSPRIIQSPDSTMTVTGVLEWCGNGLP
jgi:hypothetical protein